MPIQPDNVGKERLFEVRQEQILSGQDKKAGVQGLGAMRRKSPPGKAAAPRAVQNGPDEVTIHSRSHD